MRLTTTGVIFAGPVTPEALGVSVSLWALGASLLSLAIALSALGWQVAKHFLDGGRVKVYLNAAIWEPDFKITTNRTGRYGLPNDDSARGVTHGQAFEVAQLVVENPGRTPVTIYSPGLSISGHRQKNHSLVPRLFRAGAGFGPDSAVNDTVVRLEPYARVTFLLDYWSVVPSLIEGAPHNQVVLRGYVGVAGRTKRPQRSSRRRRWRIDRGTHTAIDGSPPFTPLAVLWREMYRQFPQRTDEEDLDLALTREAAQYVLDEAMSRFDKRPERKELRAAIEEVAQRQGLRFPLLGSAVLAGYTELDRLEGRLTAWAEGLFHGHTQRPANTAPGPYGEH